MQWLTDVLTSIVTRPGRWLLGGAAGLVLVLVAVLFGVSWLASERAMHPEPPDDAPRLEDYALAVQDVSFLARDGVRLSGWFVPGAGEPRGGAPSRAARATIVLLHGYGDGREVMLPHAAYLHRAGYNVLLFDFRATGKSEGEAVTVGALEQRDVLGALDYLGARGDIDMARVGVQGQSMGGAVAILAAAQDPRIRAVVSEGAFKDVRSTIGTAFREEIGLPAFPFAPITVWITERRLGLRVGDVSPLRAVPAPEGRPLFIIHDERDSKVPGDSGEALFAAAREPKQYWLVPGAEHAAGHLVAGAEFERRVLAFWERAFLDVAPPARGGALRQDFDAERAVRHRDLLAGAAFEVDDSNAVPTAGEEVAAGEKGTPAVGGDGDVLVRAGERDDAFGHRAGVDDGERRCPGRSAGRSGADDEEPAVRKQAQSVLVGVAGQLARRRTPAGRVEGDELEALHREQEAAVR